MSALTGISHISSITKSPSDTPRELDVENEPLELPKPTKSALRFLDRIDDCDLRHVLFKDHLVTVSDTGKELGEFTVSVEQASRKGEDCFLVHANSHGTIDNVPCGTSITAHISHNLETLEQQHHEYVKLQNHALDRKTIILKEDDEYVVNRIITQGEDVQRTAKTFNTNEMSGFISEGSNLILQRLLVKKPWEDFQLIAFDSDTVLCPVTYKRLEPHTQVVQETEVDVVGVERTINSLADLPTTWQSYYMPDGHLMSRVQVGSPVTMRVINIPKLILEEEDDEKPTFEKKDLNWEDDAELHSKFLDRKEELKDAHSVYVRHHPDLKALIADYLQFLLLRKPDDVIAFTADYFSSFSQKIPNPPAYQQSNAPSPFAECKTNDKIRHLATPR